MGTWNTDIKGNDTTLDIYSNFMEKYNLGENQVFVSNEIKQDFKDYFTDTDDRNNSFFGLALAQWETKCLEPEVLKEVERIIKSGIDIELWEKLEADEKTLVKRQKELDKFLAQISIERPKPKRRKKSKFEFTTNELVKVVSPDNKKEFVITDEFTNQEYIHTSGIMTWYSGGGNGIMYHNKENGNVKAQWIDASHLLITHDKNIVFAKKEEEGFYFGDGIKIIYKEE